MIREPSRRISWCSSPTAFASASSERKEFEQTSSARPPVLWASVPRRGRISCSTTGTPALAICQAASEPARPPPTTWMGLVMLPDIGERPIGIKRIETPASARRALSQTRRRSDAGVAARDAVDLEPGDAEVVELAIGELRQLAHRLAIGEIGADLREDHGHEHGRFLFSWALPRTGKASITQGTRLHAAMQYVSVATHPRQPPSSWAGLRTTHD